MAYVLQILPLTIDGGLTNDSFIDLGFRFISEVEVAILLLLVKRLIWSQLSLMVSSFM